MGYPCRPGSRRGADECRALAKQMTREDQREALLTMAETWDGLADDRARQAQDAKFEEGSTDAGEGTGSTTA
jgi:hypothetical protein